MIFFLTMVVAATAAGFCFGVGFERKSHTLEVERVKARAHSLLGEYCERWQDDVRNLAPIYKAAKEWRVVAAKVWDEPTIKLIAAVENGMKEEGN